ncbi:MAG: hypothetical protein NC828_03165, partial [Candidatus Omnitrophica bacterium]|nr:hypothetical protein [Candidatus Omnitrophota bacterium]
LYSLKTQITQIFFLFSVFCLLPFVCFAKPISSAELIERAKEYNNQIVEYQGEVVGDVMVRTDYAWVNLHDGKNAIGIWGRRDLITHLVKNKGGYNYKGDILLVRGIFHRACPQHGGDLDIHLDSITKIKDGVFTPHYIKGAKVVRAIRLFVVALGLAILCRFRMRR